MSPMPYHYDEVYSQAARSAKLDACHGSMFGLIATSGPTWSANFRPVWDVAQLERPGGADDVPRPPAYSFDAYYTPSQNAVQTPMVSTGDKINALFMNASESVFQRLIGTALQLLEEVKAGNEVQLRLPDGSVRQIVISVPDELRRPRFPSDGSPAQGAT
jgi:hypothetical protein